MSDKKLRPELDDSNAHIENYDEIVLGFPIWWYVAPTIINTFLEKYDFTGKKITLFATSGGSGLGNTIKELQPSAPGAEFVEGGLLNRANRQEIEKWVDKTRDDNNLHASDEYMKQSYIWKEKNNGKDSTDSGKKCTRRVRS